MPAQGIAVCLRELGISTATPLQASPGAQPYKRDATPDHRHPVDTLTQCMPSWHPLCSCLQDSSDMSQRLQCTRRPRHMVVERAGLKRTPLRELRLPYQTALPDCPTSTAPQRPTRNRLLCSPAQPSTTHSPFLLVQASHFFLPFKSSMPGLAANRSSQNMQVHVVALSC